MSCHRSITWIISMVVFVAIGLYYLVYKLQNPAITSRIEEHPTLERSKQLFASYSPSCQCSNVSMEISTLYAADPTCSAITVMTAFQAAFKATVQSVQGLQQLLRFVCSPPSVTEDDISILLATLQTATCVPAVCGAALCGNSSSAIGTTTTGFVQLFGLIGAFGELGICGSDVEATRSASLVTSLINLMNKEISSYVQSPLLLAEDRFTQTILDGARQVANLESSTVTLEYSSLAFFQRANGTSSASIGRRIAAFRALNDIISAQVVALVGAADYSNYFAQCDPVSCQYFAQETQAIIFFNSLGTIASFFAVCMLAARLCYMCTHDSIVELTPDGHYQPTTKMMKKMAARVHAAGNKTALPSPSSTPMFGVVVATEMVAVAASSLTAPPQLGSQPSSPVAAASDSGLPTSTGVSLIASSSTVDSDSSCTSSSSASLV